MQWVWQLGRVVNFKSYYGRILEENQGYRELSDCAKRYFQSRKQYAINGGAVYYGNFH